MRAYFRALLVAAAARRHREVPAPYVPEPEPSPEPEPEPSGETETEATQACNPRVRRVLSEHLHLIVPEGWLSNAAPGIPLMVPNFCSWCGTRWVIVQGIRHCPECDHVPQDQVPA